MPRLRFDAVGKTVLIVTFVVITAAVLTGVVYAAFNFNLSSFNSWSRSSVEKPVVNQELRILAYSSFAASWGPGPTLAKMFEDEIRNAPDGAGENIKVTVLQAEDSRLLLAKMNSFSVDVVIGFDQLGLARARKEKSWRPHGVQASRFSNDTFFAFDWAPLGFIYRAGEIKPPKSLQDLLDVRFRKKIALQDPRTSSPGFQFLSWLVHELGEDEAFRYLEKLKPNIHSVSASWSQAYGLFTRGLAATTPGYVTSILYHRMSEKDDRYRFAAFSSGAPPIQIEYAAIADSCGRCDLAVKFIKFLSEVPAQTTIMNKNWMFPVNPHAAEGSPFQVLMTGFEQIAEIATDVEISTANRTSEVESVRLLKRWKEVGL